MANVNFFSPDGGTTRYPIEDTEARSRVAGQQSLVKDTVGWTGKNRAYSQTNNAVIAHIENGITYDVSWTGSATVTLKKNSASGATITSGSTSPLSFTADADYELYFGSSATVTNIMVKDSRITDPTYEPYHESVEVMHEEEIHGVNLLENKATTQTVNGITFTVNSDGSVKANGTGTTLWAVLFLNSIALPKGSYILSGTPANANCYLVMRNNGVTLYNTSNGQDKIIELSEDTTFDTVQINIAPGTTISNLVFYPMIRKANIEDSTYRPYNEQAIQNQLNAQGVLGAKNLFKVTATSQTRDGVTFTVNKDSDGNVLNVTANGTSADGRIALGRVELDVGTYKLNGSPKSPSLYNWRLRLFDPSTDFVIAWDDGEGAIFTVSTKTTYELQIRYAGNVTFNNVVFKPMIRLASDPDDTYQPYAMTNRELTEIVNRTKLLGTDDLDTVFGYGDYYWENVTPLHSPENNTFCAMHVYPCGEVIHQEIIRGAGSNASIYLRRYQNTWSSWYKFTGTVVS